MAYRPGDQPAPCANIVQVNGWGTVCHGGRYVTGKGPDEVLICRECKAKTPMDQFDGIYYVEQKR